MAVMCSDGISRLFHFQNDLSSRPVLIIGKRPKFQPFTSGVIYMYEDKKKVYYFWVWNTK